MTYFRSLRLPTLCPAQQLIAQRPLLALVMIVKDEAHTLADTLRNMRPVIDAYYILDTGSTDGTPQLIRSELAATASAPALPGAVFSEPFVDYGTTRNRIMDLANSTTLASERPVFVVMLSADETMSEPWGVRVFLEANRMSEGPQHGAYPVVMNAGIDFDSVGTDAHWQAKKMGVGWDGMGWGGVELSESCSVQALR